MVISVRQRPGHMSQRPIKSETRVRTASLLQWYDHCPLYIGTSLTLCTETGELVCGPDSYPLRDLQFDFSRERDPLQKRINRWLRQIARSEGHDVPFEEDDIQPQHFTGPVWQEWGKNDWVCAMEAFGPLAPLEPDPLSLDEASDPKLKADFNFVEKTARKRKMTEKDARRLHIVFRVQVYFALCRVTRSHRAYFIGTNGRKAQENQ